MSQYATWPIKGGGGGSGLVITAVDNPLVYNNISGHLSILDASAVQDGTVSTGTQTFAGNKTFTGSLTVLGIINANGGIDRSTSGTLTIGATNSTIINIGNSGATVNIQGSTIFENTPLLQVADPLITVNHGGGAGSGQNAGIQVEENAIITGYAETSADRNSWIFKAPNTAGIVTLTPGVSGFTLDQGSHNPVTLGTANGLSLSVQVLSLQLADATHTGALSNTDWVTFNSKQASGNYITALTGDVTATGPGSVTATIPVGTVTDTKGSLANKPSATVVATTNQALTGFPTIDGVTVVSGSIILLSAQTTGSQNGPWVAAAGAWSRPTWYPSGGTTQAFQFITILIRLGTTYQGSTWRETAAGPITIDTTSTTWVVTPLALNASTVTGVLPAANVDWTQPGTIGSTTPNTGAFTSLAAASETVTNGATGGVTITNGTAGGGATPSLIVLTVNGTANPQPQLELQTQAALWRIVNTGNNNNELTFSENNTSVAKISAAGNFWSNSAVFDGGSPTTTAGASTLYVVSNASIGVNAAAPTGGLIVNGRTLLGSSTDDTVNELQVTGSATVSGNATISTAAASKVTLGGTSSTAGHQINGAMQLTTKTITAATYTVDTTTTDRIIFTDSTSNAITITLPAPTNGRILTIQDKTGKAGTNAITVVQHAAETLNGLTQLVLAQNYAGMTLTSDGTNWSIMKVPTSGNALLTSGVTYTTPTNITPETRFKFTLIGGGAAGGGVTATVNQNGSGGGSGGSAIVYVSNLSANTGYTIAIGAAGTGSSGAGGGNGGNTTLSINATTYTAAGGTGGAVGAATVVSGGAGGTTTNATVGINGQAGGDGQRGGDSSASGLGGSTLLGFGGTPVGHAATGSTSGKNGVGYGAGGSGSAGGAASATASTGGNGVAGVILVEWAN